MTEILHLLEDIQKECPEKMPIFEEKNFRAVCLTIINKQREYRLLLGLLEKILQDTQQNVILETKKHKRK